MTECHRDIVGIVARRDNDADARAWAPAQVGMRRKTAFGRRQSHGHKVALQPGQDHLGFWIAKTRVELESADTLSGEHQAGVEHTAKLIAGAGELLDSGTHNAVDDLLDERVIDTFRRRVRTHAARVRAFVALVRSFVVACRREGDDVGAVGHGKKRKLRAFEPLFDHDLLAAAPEALLDQHRFDRAVGLLDVRANDHAFATSQAVCLDRDASAALAGPGFRRRRLGKDFEVRGRDAGALHQRLRKGLAGLDAARAAVRPEHIEAGMAKGIADAGVDSRLGTEHDEAEPFALGEIDNPHDVRGADRNVARHATGASVAGRAVHALHELRLDALPDKRMLPRSGAHDQDLQAAVFKSRIVPTIG